MQILRTRRHFAAAVFLLAFAVGPPLAAQTRTHVNTPGAAFSPERPVEQLVVENIAGGGRRFRGQGRQLLKLRAVLRLPRARSDKPQMLRLAVHFRAPNFDDPSLRLVEVRNGTNVAFRMVTRLRGDYTARARTAPEDLANTWEFTTEPITVDSQSVIRLEVQLPGGIDSMINPGEFILNAVRVTFASTPTITTPITRHGRRTSPKRWRRVL